MLTSPSSNSTQTAPASKTPLSSQAFQLWALQPQKTSKRQSSMSAQQKISSFYGNAVPRPFILLQPTGKPVDERVDPPRVNTALLGECFAAHCGPAPPPPTPPTLIATPPTPADSGKHNSLTFLFLTHDDLPKTCRRLGQEGPLHFGWADGEAHLVRRDG
jgi:hypothetical protein